MFRKGCYQKVKKALISIGILSALVGCQRGISNNEEIESLKHQVEELQSQIENQTQEPQLEEREEMKTYLGSDVQKLIEGSTENEFVVESLNLYSADWSRSLGNLLGFNEMNQYFLFVDEEYFESVVDRYNNEGQFVLSNSVFKYNTESNIYEVYDSENNLLGNITHRHNISTTDLVNMLDYEDEYTEKDIYDEVIQKQSEVVLDQPVLLAEVRGYNGEFLYTVTGADGWYIVGEDESMATKLIEIAKQNNHVITEYLHFEYLPQHDFYEVTFLPLGSDTLEGFEFIGYLVSIHDYPYFETEEIYSAYE